MSRTVHGFWWTWREGDEWPAWYYEESTARAAAKKLAKDSPGRKVYAGDLCVVSKLVLPDEVIELKE